MVKETLAIVVMVLALRLPFLHQAIQGDDLYYLYGAEHAQIEPLHPDRATYLFQGDLVDMRGHSHPPLNSWILGALLWAFHDVREVPFHLAYSIFSIVAALAMFSLGRRFCDKPLLATMLFIAVPAFVVNGNSLEADLPFLALWMLAIAWFVKGIEENSRLALVGSALTAAVAALDAYQAVFIVPILAFYLWQKGNRSVLAWCAIFAAPVAIVAWQISGRVSGGEMPAAILWGYMQKYALQVAAQKVKNAGALLVHSAWILSPLLIRGSRWHWILGAIAAGAGAFYDPNPMFWASLGLGVVLLLSCFRRGFLEAWILIFFACALIVFFAGS
ncbi:MAG: glycosyltransferase family 39 protein, partial [Bryobacteraceae bacterium]